MTAKISHLCVFANLNASWIPCGDLSLTEDGADLLSSNFIYDQSFLQRVDAFGIDPVSLPVNKKRSMAIPVRPVNDLPCFGALRDATPDAWGRRVIEAKLGLSLNSLPESEYLVHAGSNRVGALDVRPDVSAEPITAPDGWNTLPNLVDAADQIDRGLPVSSGLDGLLVQGAALGGARPKACVRDERGTLHVAKFSSHGDRFDIPAVEYATLRLAEKAGLRVPTIRLVQVNDSNVLLVRRFDRYWSSPGDERRQGDNRFVRGDATAGAVEHRIPFVSALTIAGCDETDSRNMSYASLGACMQTHCRTLLAYDGAAELFKRMVFNIFVSNNDDHLRNFGFVWDAELQSWRLSPVYDVVPQSSVASERYQHLVVGTSGKLATLDNAVSRCSDFLLNPRETCDLIAQVWEVVRNWRADFDSNAVDARDADHISTAFRHIDDISSAELRHRIP